MFIARISGQVLKNFLNIRSTLPLARSINIYKRDGDCFEESDIDREYDRLADTFIQPSETHNCLVIQPYVKWGPRKLPITPEEQLEEAVALIKTLPSWRVDSIMTVPLESLDKKSLFKSGNMDKISDIINKNRDVTAVFINSSNLSNITSQILYENFHLPILDRYKIVMQILKIHATSKHAKLQVALAELYYIQRKAKKNNVFKTHDPEVLKLMFQRREQKLKQELAKLRSQRSLLRNKRQKLNHPVVAVVGYTNAGKTCLIKALTGEKELQPKDQLFATLDVTLHAGILPSRMNVLFVDTVGFLSDIPTNLIECFIATLEDAVLADVILHVEDLSSSCFEYKRDHVIKTLKDIGAELGADNIMDKVFSIGNKCDLVTESEGSDLLPVSAKHGIGLEELKIQLENKIVDTSRKRLTIKVKNGGEESRWLYKNSTVLSQIPCEEDLQYLKLKVIITETNLNKFKHYFK